MSELAQLFLFAAKAGSLEGYVYRRDEADSLDNWVDNILKMYDQLPDRVKKEIAPELKVVLGRTLSRSGKGLDSKNRTRLAELLESVNI